MTGYASPMNGVAGSLRGSFEKSSRGLFRSPPFFFSAKSTKKERLFGGLWDLGFAPVCSRSR